jgi:hypothetical protein
VTAAIMMVIYLMQAGHQVSYYDLAIMVAALSFCLGLAYTPWMASFTETVEARNPALAATGLAIWGWIIRVVVFASYLIIPHVINSVTPLVNYGTQAKVYEAQYGKEIAIVESHPALFAQLARFQNNPGAIPPSLLAQAVQAAGGTSELLKIQQATPALTFLQQHGTQLQHAAKDSPGQWKDWYWVCFGGMVVFIGCVPILRGRWSPKAAKADEEAHEAMVQIELAKLHA